ncbi:sigma-70 family RNA polymerase sigma factor [Nonomuraea sp. KM90]|uniref:sigma-70 family RNA polymerase sigma factor n=1 Tax=Nonomuraea sp. KM90 TaxID=3457428 RepID=UPI003FCE8EFB
MPGWPTIDRAGDQELVEALLRADTDAPAKLYDSYAERLYDYAVSLAEEGDLAADAVHDALVTAQGCVERLREPARLRAWLYALTRFQVRARLARRPGTPAGGLPLPEVDGHDDPELADLVHETLGELSRGEREVLELSLRHGLTPSEVGAVLGLTSRQSAARLGRARDQLENAAAAVVLARTGRAHCPDLSAMVDSWEGPLTPLLRRRLSGHISGCEVCTEGRHRQVSAGRLLDMVPVAYPAISLRRRVIDTCVNPELDQTRVLITDRGDSFDRTGFPVAVEHGRSRRRRPRRLAPLMLAGVCLLAATGAMVVINGQGASDTTTLRPAPSPTLPVEEDPTPEPVIEEDELTPSPAPTPSRTPSARTTPSQPPTASRPSTRPATRAATRPTPGRRPAPGARLGASCPQSISGVAKIGLSARNAAVSWVATASQGLDVFPASGSVKAGGSVSIWVTVVEPNDSGSGRVSFTSNGGTATCSLSWQGDGPRIPDSPTDEPPATEEPTQTPSSGVATSSEEEPAAE